MRTLLTSGALALMMGLGAITQAKAGIVVTSQGVEITPPAAHQATRLGPASGFRRFGRAGFFATPVDPGLPFHGRFSYGAASRQAWENARREAGPRLPGDSIFTGAIFGWFD